MNHTTHIDTRDKYLSGFWLYIMSDCLLFASLFATYAVLHANTAGGPGARELFSLPFVLGETLILLASSFVCGLAVIAMHRGSALQALAWLLVTAALGASFLALEMNEFSTLVSDGHSWQRSAFLSSFFLLVGTHGFHVAMGLLWMLVVMLQVVMRGFTENVVRRFLSLVLFWHFLDIVWIFIFSFVYILPLLV